MNEKEQKKDLTNSTSHKTAPEPLFKVDESSIEGPTSNNPQVEVDTTAAAEEDGASGQQSGPTISWTVPPLVERNAFTVAGVWSQVVAGFTVSDISVSSGSILANSFSVVGRIFSLVITPPSSGSGTLTISVPANRVTPSNCSQSTSVRYRGAVASTDRIIFWNRPRHGQQLFTYVQQFSISGRWTAQPSNFQESDFIITANGSTLSFTNYNYNQGNYSFRGDLTPPSGTGTIRIRIPADSIIPSNPEQVLSLAYAPPTTITWTTPSGTQYNGDTLTITGRFNQNVSTTFTRSDIFAVSVVGTVTTTLSVINFSYNASNRTFSYGFRVPSRGSGTLTSGLDAGVTVIDPPTGDVRYNFSLPYGPRPATPTITWTVPSGTQIARFNVRGRWSHTVGTTFTRSDVTARFGSTNATISNFTYPTITSSNDFSFDVTPPSSGSGTIVISVAANRVTPANTLQSVCVSFGQPSTVTWSIPSGTQVSAFNVSGAWSQTVTGFDVSDITSNLGSTAISSFSQIGRVFTFRVTPPTTGSGTITINIAANSVSPPNTLQSTSIPYAQPTTITWTTPTGTQTQAFVVRGRFNQNVGTTFTSLDITVRAGSTTLSFSNFAYCSTTRRFSLDVTPPSTGSGTIVVSVAANRVTPANTLQSVCISYTQPPTIAWCTPTGTQVSEFNVSGTWSQTISGFTSSDVSVNTGRISSFTTSGRTFSFIVTPPTTGSGTITITVRANAVTPNNRIQSTSVVYTQPSSVSWTTPTGTQTGPFSVTGQWSNNVGTTFTSSDISLSPSAGSFDSFTYVSSTRNFGFRILPPNGLSGTLTISIAAGSVTPRNTLQSVSVQYNTIAVATIAAANQNQTNGTITYAITWTNATSYTGFDASDITYNLTITGTTGTILPRQTSTLARVGTTNVFNYIVYPETGEQGTINISLARNILQSNVAVTSPTTNYDLRSTLSNHPSATFEVPTGVQTGTTFDIIVDFGETLQSSNSLDTRASASNSDLLIVGATASFATLTTLTTRRRYRVRITSPTNQLGYLSLQLLKDVVTNSRNLIGPVQAQYSPSVTYDTRTAVTTGDAPTVRWELPNGIQTGLSYNIPFEFRRGSGLIEVVGMAPGELDTEGISGAGEAVFTRNWEFTMPATVTSFAASNITINGVTINSVTQASEDATKWIVVLTTDSTSAPGRGIATLTTSLVTITGISGVTRPTSIRSRSSTYVAQVFPPNNQQGTLNTIIRANAVTTIDGSSGPDRDTSFGSVAFDRVLSAVATIGSAENSSGTTLTTIQDTFFVDITWTSNVTGFTQNDLIVTNACIASFTGTGSAYRVSLTPQLNRNGIITLAIPADIITTAGGNEFADRNFEYVIPTVPTIENFDWPDTIPAGAGTFFVDIDFNTSVTGLASTDLILDAPSSVSITSITWGTTSITSTARASRTRGSTLSTVGAAGKQYYRVNLTKTSSYAGEQVTLALKADAVLGPNPANQT